jgi:predicted ATPase
MRITSLIIHNLRAITSFEINNLEQVVLIAGPNGCGKSCVFDAIRLLKSCYGGYQPNEWQQWFGEFEIRVNQANANLAHLARDKTKQILIKASFQLTNSERQYLVEAAPRMATKAAWEIVAPHTQGYGTRPVARDIRTYEPEVLRVRDEITQAVSEELAKPNLIGEVTVDLTTEEIKTKPSQVLELVFSTYEPKHLGIIDYYSANRVFSREQIGGINLNLDSENNNQNRQHTLYNSQGKYANIKSEMAASFVRDLIAGTVGENLRESQVLTKTLQELFQTFFPDKKFVGPRADSKGGIYFPVEVSGGGEHDINDLSSGEKEVLFGYLRLRNSTPHNSVILLDEPEIHLNPALIKGLPQFYRKHIGEALDNQIFLVTHSDAFLREAAGQPGFSLFHMQHPASATESNQVRIIHANDELEIAILDLIGDLATYRPGARLIIFEGENSEFDKKLTTKFFPSLEKNANLISAGSKTNARKIHMLLQKAAVASSMPSEIHVILDGDNLHEELPGTVHTWPVYHIENFLLEPLHIFQVLSDLSDCDGKFATVEDVRTGLREAAEQTLEALVVRIQVRG